MIQTSNNNFSPWPWYSDIEYQNHRKSYAYGNIYPLYCPADMLLPFQVIRPHRDNAVPVVKMFTVNGEFVMDVTYMGEAGLTVVPFADRGIDVLLFPGDVLMPTNMPIGQYYFVMSDGLQTWYSEVVTIVHDITPYMQVRWYNTFNLWFDAGVIVYEERSYKNTLYFCAELGKPEYPFEEEGETMDGYFFAEKQISEKTYRTSVLAPEYLCDVMRLIRMADYVEVMDKYGRLYSCDTFMITPEWQTQGDLAAVEVEFQTDTVVKKIPYYRGEGDFNGDFNEDFKIK